MGKSDAHKDAEAQAAAQVKAHEAATAEAYARSQPYVGDAGYKRSYDLGKEAAAGMSQSQLALANTASRGAGMTAAQAAMMGSQQAAGNYGSNLSQQQQSAYQSGLDAVNVEQARVGNVGTTSNLASQNLSAHQADRTANTSLGGAITSGAGSAILGAGMLFSDEKMKKYESAGKILEEMRKRNGK